MPDYPWNASPNQPARRTRLEEVRKLSLFPWTKNYDQVGCHLYWMPFSMPNNAPRQREWVIAFAKRLEIELALSGAEPAFFLQLKVINDHLSQPFYTRVRDISPIMGLSRRPGASLPSVPDEKYIEGLQTGKIKYDMDDYGLGIHPEEEPPRTWNRGDFEKVTLNDKLPPLFLEIMRASSRHSGAVDAVRNRFFGTGGYAEAYTQPGANFYTEATALFKPRITNSTARMFPYHAPIVRRRAAECASLLELEQWMCGASLYVRESVEEEGIILLFHGSSTDVLEQAMRNNMVPTAMVEFVV